jgi:hypothetical protein
MPAFFGRSSAQHSARDLDHLLAGFFDGWNQPWRPPLWA